MNKKARRNEKKYLHPLSDPHTKKNPQKQQHKQKASTRMLLQAPTSL
jgi:hypothetical protein